LGFCLLQDTKAALTGGTLIEALQACRHREIEFEPGRSHQPVGNISF
jgi:hypothetical protein